MAADSPCGDWELYKDEKCFKVLGKVGTEEEAEKICSQQENRSTLITIHSKDEQDFLSNLLFKTHNVVDSVWIGAKYSSNKFKWADDSDLSFTNWDNGSPSNTTDKACVQMIAEGSSMGKWITEPCSKSNKVVCQKMQTWSVSLMQKTLLDARKELNDTLEDLRKQINNQQSTINSHQSTINDLKQNPVPIGFIYVQLPSQPEPKILWSTVEWKDVTSDYAGLFFRAEGGGSAAFGEKQEESSYRLTQVENKRCSGGNPINVNVGTWSDYVYTGSDGNTEYWCLRFMVSNSEVRPSNKAMRIWKRTK
jgi:hypothetical protein